MRRTLIMTIASTFVLAVAPGAALAHHHGGKHKGHHHVRVKKFGSDTPNPNGGTSSSSSDTAGTVSSFSGGVLTIKLNDGSMVSGKVTNDTEIECRAPESQPTTTGGDDSGSGDDNSGDGDHQGGDSQGQPAGSHDASDTGETENEDANEGQAACDSSALTPGAVVREAEVRISSGGATWKKVELQK